MFGVEWFGLWPNNGDISVGLLDQSAILQAAVNATPRVNGKLILPEFGITVRTASCCQVGRLLFRRRCWTGRPDSGIFRNNAAILHWNGPTNLPMIKLRLRPYHARQLRALDTCPHPTPRIGPTRPPSRSTLDMPSGTTTTTADVFKGLMFASAGRTHRSKASGSPTRLSTTSSSWSSRTASSPARARTIPTIGFR